MTEITPTGIYTPAEAAPDPCTIIGSRCWDFDDYFWNLEMFEGYDEALRKACKAFGISIAQGEAILVCHDTFNDGNG